MKVRELIEWLQAFDDQDATVRVLHCQPAHSYYMQGGETSAVDFDPELHSEYTDLRENPFCKGKPWANEHSLLLGAKEA
ncbi:hypothetical protein ACS9ZL_08525 [Stenotrophomonas africana]